MKNLKMAVFSVYTLAALPQMASAHTCAERLYATGRIFAYSAQKACAGLTEAQANCVADVYTTGLILAHSARKTCRDLTDAQANCVAEVYSQGGQTAHYSRAFCENHY
ncbi:MAG TPA: hypothetical protein VIG33_13620 [Pseudobdellovibrionaceae bacterium]|jgi:hypothetical protein